MKKTVNRFLYRRTLEHYEVRYYKKKFTMSEHEFLLVKETIPNKDKWLIVDKNAGILVCKGKFIDEAYEELERRKDNILFYLNTDCYKKLVDQYNLVLDDWKRNKERFEEFNNYVLGDE